MNLTCATPVETESASFILADYYRCAGEAVRFSAEGDAKGPAGYFRFGADTICYGQLAGAEVAKSLAGKLHDALARARIEAGAIGLPFDAGQVIEDLRRERYTARFRDEGPVLNELARKSYYCVRPFLGDTLRRYLQKMYLWRWDKIAFPSWPVDITVDRIHQKLFALSLKAQGLKCAPFIWFWPDGFSSCAIMTHDVEEETGRDFCGRLMDVDESFGFRSSFQLVPESRYLVANHLLDDIRSRGFEVNIHDLKHDGRLYAERSEFLRRVKRINGYARKFGADGFRSGILYRNADWFDAFEFSYDMSLPNVAHLDPQRGGCCTVMPFFVGDILELPLTCTQDYTLFQILGDYSTELWETQIALIQKQHGLISFIVHPDYIADERALGTYQNLLGYLARLRQEEGVWTPLPGEVAAWWRQRSKMELVKDHGQWQVQGEGSERARIAYAYRAGDTVTYAFPHDHEALANMARDSDSSNPGGLPVGGRNR